MATIRFFLDNRRMLSFGFLLTFFSSFGQTFLISLYVPDIIKEFDLTSLSFGTLYGSATVLSGLTLAYAGKFIDHCSLRSYTLAAVGLLAASCLCIAVSMNIVLVFLGFFGLRLAGQGLLSHISNTSVSKYFDKTRGRALSLSVMGYPAGEALFPLAVGGLIAHVGWRASMLVSALFVVAILAPFVFAVLKNQRFTDADEDKKPKDVRAFSSMQLWTDRRFQIIALSTFIMPFMITGLFFYHLMLAEEKGWSMEWLTASFLGFAVGRTVFSLVSGKLIDRFSALRLFPFYLVPFLVALCGLTVINHPLMAAVYLALTGIAQGLSSTIRTALLAEVYGTANIGSIRAMSSTVMVFSTALSPALFGFLLDMGLSFEYLTAGCAGVIVLVIFANTQLPNVIPKFEQNAPASVLRKAG